MSLELGLSQEDLAILSKELEKDPEYQKVRDKMRAAVLLCTQELMNDETNSAFEKFHRTLPDNPNIPMALAAAASYLESLGLKNVISVLNEEVNSDILQQGEEALEARFQGKEPKSVLPQLAKNLQ
ncbi:hypothetical protein GPJ56_010671 [Histomonas meleagridis]|uniref:uncharacterized protein n=1 Tax=Histomonas meleagridis TaxID=135588 RepID=UPI00355A7CE9|nr:hypothetical protein GPJ56_010671 [Histomonas meleagridis]KAH0806943.1 hypothetical protein GO595_000119 [Histomonas meleagridis]